MIELSNSLVKTRKPHQCFGCLREMPKGTRMDRSAYAHDGSVYSVYICIPCFRILAKYRGVVSDSDGTISEGIIWDAMSHFNVTSPEELLFKTKVQGGNLLDKYFGGMELPF